MASDRGQLTAGPAARVIGFIALVVTGALLWSVLDPAASTALTVSNETTSHSTYNTHVGLLDLIWNNELAYILALGALGTIVTIFAITR